MIKSNTKIKIGWALFLIASVLYVIENFYFGWNRFPMSDSEKATDAIVTMFYTLGIIFYLLPILDIYERRVKSHDLNNELLK